MYISCIVTPGALIASGRLIRSAPTWKHRVTKCSGASFYRVSFVSTGWRRRPVCAPTTRDVRRQYRPKTPDRTARAAACSWCQMTIWINRDVAAIMIVVCIIQPVASRSQATERRNNGRPFRPPIGQSCRGRVGAQEVAAITRRLSADR